MNPFQWTDVEEELMNIYDVADMAEIGQPGKLNEVTANRGEVHYRLDLKAWTVDRIESDLEETGKDSDVLQKILTEINLIEQDVWVGEYSNGSIYVATTYEE